MKYNIMQNVNDIHQKSKSTQYTLYFHINKSCPKVIFLVMLIIPVQYGFLSCNLLVHIYMLYT